MPPLNRTRAEAAHHGEKARQCKKALHIKVTVQPDGKVAITSPELEAGQPVEVVVLHESGVKGRSIKEVLNSDPDHRLSQTAEEVKACLAEEKASWDRYTFLSLAWSTTMPAVSSTAWNGWSYIARF